MTITKQDFIDNFVLTFMATKLGSTADPSKVTVDDTVKTAYTLACSVYEIKKNVGGHKPRQDKPVEEELKLEEPRPPKRRRRKKVEEVEVKEPELNVET